ncbi:MAG TPA: ATP-binding protein [Rhodanobacter sp.]|jgi:anti-sigma regulatory factor (Ser/Thr protein kinase)|nr:ATP-binding protein [Rhodanobacter sp.]
MTEPPDATPADCPACRECRDFARSLGALEEIYAFVEPLFASHRIGREATFALIMTIEELFTNMVKYNPAGRGPISLEVQCAADAVTCQLSDPDSARFDMTRLPDVDIRQPVERRHPGGLGIHLIRRLVDSIDYDHAGRCSRVRFVRKLSAPARADHMQRQ